jgi:hypothetical protein
MLIDENKYPGQDVYIIGKGPSLHNLTKEMIGEGIIITLNDAIQKIEELDLPNIVYSMQKDGVAYKNVDFTNNNFWYKPPTLEMQICNDCSLHSIMPKKSILLVHKHESSLCSLDYKPRMVFDNLEMGLLWHDFSALSAIRIAEIMGCTKFYFVSFDAITNMDNSGYANTAPLGYSYQYPRMKPYLDRIDYKFITP